MSLTNKIGKSIAILGLTSTLNCADEGDTHYHIYGNDGSGESTGSGSADSGSNMTYNCDDIYQRYVLECNANGNDSWEKGDLGPTYECEQGNYPQNSPAWTKCIFEVPCEQINEVCDPLFNQEGI